MYSISKTRLRQLDQRQLLAKEGRISQSLLEDTNVGEGEMNTCQIGNMTHVF